MLSKPIKWLTEDKDVKSSTFSGFVVGNDDPLKLGRVQVRIVEMYGTSSEIPDEDLPWLNIIPSSFIGNTSTTSTFGVPEIGTKVLVDYPTSNPYFGFYRGGYNSLDVRNDFFDDDYPNSYGFKDSQDNYFRINKTKNIMELHHNSGSRFKIYQDRSMDIYHFSGTIATINPNGSVTFSVVDDVYGEIQGNCNLNIGGNTNVTCPQVTFNSSSFVINSPSVSIVGDITHDGSGVSSGDWVAGGISQTGHVHIEQGDGSPTSPPQ